LIEVTKRAGGEGNGRLMHNEGSKPRIITGGSSTTVEISLVEKLHLEEYNEWHVLGRFVWHRGGETIAVGMLDSLVR